MTEIKVKRFTGSLSRFPISDLLNLCRNIIIIVERSSITALLTHPLYQTFKEIYERLYAVLNKMRRSGMGDVVQESDKKRNKTYGRLKRALKVEADMNSEKGYASKALLEIITAPGVIPKMAYARKTEQLSKVLEVLATSKNRQLAEIAGVESYIDDLKESQKTFISLVAEQRDADSALNQKDTASHLKPELVNALRNLLDLIYANRFDEEWRDVCFDIHEAVEFARVILRSGKKKEK